jgi:hypothetical protein
LLIDDLGIKIVNSLSHFGKCQTILLNEKRNILTDIIIFSINEKLNMNFRNNEKFIQNEYIFHSSNTMYSYFTDKFSLNDYNYYQLGAQHIIIQRYSVQKLPKPYDTNCKEYGESNRYECLNQCFLNGYNQKWNCTPNTNHLLTIILFKRIIY